MTRLEDKLNATMSHLCDIYDQKDNQLRIYVEKMLSELDRGYDTKKGEIKNNALDSIAGYAAKISELYPQERVKQLGKETIRSGYKANATNVTSLRQQKIVISEVAESVLKVMDRYDIERPITEYLRSLVAQKK